MVLDLQEQLRGDLAQIRFLLGKNPGMGYARILEIGKQVGRRYGIKMIVNFPKAGRIDEFEMYGRRDLSIIVDQERKRFPIDRSLIKEKAVELLGDVHVSDAYMYENKEGVRLSGHDWKIDILPHSVHVWTEFTEPVREFMDWLLEHAYEMRKPG